MSTAKASARLDVRDLLRVMTDEQRKQVWAETMSGPYPGPIPAVATLPSLSVPGPLKSMDTVCESAAVPLVACVLVTHDAKRLKLARQAVNAFVAQTYPNKRLIIVNATDQPVTNVGYSLITEARVSPGKTVGAMRNEGFSIALRAGLQVDWWCQWDDDDYSNPHRLTYQMAMRGKDSDPVPVLLRRQLRIHVQNSTAFIHDDPAGIDRTLLFPNSSRMGSYPDTSEREDLQFLSSSWGGRRVVVDNQEGAGAALVTAFYAKGLNITPEPIWMGRYFGEQYHRRSGVEHPFDQQALLWALKLYGFNTQVKSDGPSGKDAVSTGSVNTPVGVSGTI